MSGPDIEPCPFCGAWCFLGRSAPRLQVRCSEVIDCKYAGPAGRFIEREGDWDADGYPTEQVKDGREELDAIMRHNAVARRARAMDELVSEVTNE